MPERRYITIALISMTMIGLELSWTRIFSAEFFYSFAFLILSLAVLGIGLGALALRLFPKLNEEKYLPISGFLCGLTAILGPILVFRVDIDFDSLFSGFDMIFKLIIVVIILNSSYFFGGIAIAKIFKSGHNDMPKLYMSDLTGAGAGVLLILLLMNVLGTPAASFLSALPVAIAIYIAGRKKIYKLLSLSLLLLIIILSINSESLLEVKNRDKVEVIDTHWDAMSKVKVLDYHERVKGIMVDNKAGSNVIKFDGNLNSPYALDIDFGINASNIFKRYNNCTFLSVGAGGGMDILQALIEGAEELHAVEINPYINDIMTDGWLAEYSGNIYNNPKVKVITDDARAYIRKFENKFDFIFSRSANSYAALASGSFALAENYLFTTGAIKDIYKALTDSGVVLIEHKSYIPRTVSTVLEALDELEIKEPAKHIAVYNAPVINGRIILVSKEVMSDEFILTAFTGGNTQNANSIYPVHPLYGRSKGVINTIIEGGYKKASRNYPAALTPCTDDKPFVAQLGQWKNFSLEKLSGIGPLDEFMGFPLSQLMIVIILIIIIILIIPLNILPYAFNTEKLKFVPWMFFFLLGMAFMIVEVVLMQKYTLLIGPSVYSIITILLVLLVSSGIGSYYSVKFSTKSVFAGILTWLLLDIFVFTELMYVFGSWDISFRILATALMIFPLGFFMGMPFPKAATKVGSLIDWGFAVNGAGSVFGGTSIILIAISFGFNICLLIGFLLYLITFFLLERKWN